MLTLLYWPGGFYAFNRHKTVTHRVSLRLNMQIEPKFKGIWRNKMPIAGSQLQEKSQSLSPEEQKELARQLQESIQKMFSGFAQQLAGRHETVMPSLAQYIRESIKPSISDILGKGLSFNDFFKSSLGDFFKGYLTGLMQQTFGAGERYSKPAYIPPLFYPAQKSPQVISMYTVYLPVLNYMVPFLIILVKRKH